MALIQSCYWRPYGVMLKDGTTAHLAPFASVSIDDSLLDSPHLQEHVKEGRCVVKKEESSASPAKPKLVKRAAE